MKTESENKILVNVRVACNAKKNEVRSESGKYMIYTTAKPENNNANDKVVELLGRYLHLRKSAIRIVSGLRCRDKIIEIERR